MALFLLLSNPALASEGAKSGLFLWSQAVLPTLLPFMICSNVIVAMNAVPILIFPVKCLLHSVFRLSEAGSYVLVSGLLCGYPMGAKTCSEFMDCGKMESSEGQYLLAICNHPSPMFLLGYAAASLPESVPVWVLICAVYLPIFPVSYMARRYYGIEKPFSSSYQKTTDPMQFDDSLLASCEVMVRIGGYIMLFSILAEYIQKLPMKQAVLKAMLLGVIEITTGIQAIAHSATGLLCGLSLAAITAFGGLSGIFQTKSVIKNAGLSIRHYTAWKAIHSLLSILVFILLASLLPVR